MSIQIEILNEELIGFSDEAKRKLSELIKNQAEQLIEECQRLDAAGRIGSSTPDINRSIVERAFVTRKPDMIQKKKRWYRHLPSLVSSGSAIFAGAFWKDPFVDNGQVIAFIVALTIFIVSTMSQFLPGVKDE